MTDTKNTQAQKHTKSCESRDHLIISTQTTAKHKRTTEICRKRNNHHIHIQPDTWHSHKTRERLHSRKCTIRAQDLEIRLFEFVLAIVHSVLCTRSRCTYFRVVRNAASTIPMRGSKEKNTKHFRPQKHLHYICIYIIQFYSHTSNWTRKCSCSILFIR